MKFNWHRVLAGELNRSRYVERYGSFPHIHKESVAEHSYFVAMYAIFLWEELERTADLERVLIRALAHDMEESVTGDMLRAVKYSSDGLKQAMDEAGEVLLDDMLKKIETPKVPGDDVRARGTAYLKAAWRYAKDDTLEGAIVAVADLLCVVSYAHIEHQLGNRHANTIRSEVGGNLGKLREKIQFKYPSISDTCRKRLINVIDDVQATLLMEYPYEGNPS